MQGLYFLRYPENAPKEDWINEIPNCQYTPLSLLAKNPRVAVHWEKDPFIQLIEMGANTSSDLIKVICSDVNQAKKTSAPEYITIQSSRIKKLIEKGVSLPKNLNAEDQELLEKMSI